MSVILSSWTECRCLGYTENKTVTPPLALITIPEGCPTFMPQFIIDALNSLTSKVPIAIWGYQFYPFMNLFYPSFNLKLISEFKLINLKKTKSDFVFGKLSPITNVPIVSYMLKLKEIDNKYTKWLPSG